MPTSIQILTKNHEATISACIESLLSTSPQIVIGDLGSTDQTVEKCSKYPVELIKLGNLSYDKARNLLTQRSKNFINLFLYGNEYVYSGIENLPKIDTSGHVSIVSGQLLTKEIRAWNSRLNYKFTNPVFECLDTDTDIDIDLTVISTAVDDVDSKLKLVREWKKASPLDAKILYYESLLLFAKQDLDGFLNTSQQYLFVNKANTKQATMQRYYYSLGFFLKNKPVECLQNLVLCLTHYPMMAEFWCLAGDVYYHLYKKFSHALELYRNAKTMGKFRLRKDFWPMDISKYEDYPDQMIESCLKIIRHKIDWMS